MTIDSGRITGNPEVIPLQKSGCGKLRSPSSLATVSGQVTARPEDKAFENHAILGKADLRESLQPNEILKNRARAGLLDTLRRQRMARKNKARNSPITCSMTERYRVLLVDGKVLEC